MGGTKIVINDDLTPKKRSIKGKITEGYKNE